MAANDEILGISAHMDGTEVEQVLEKMISDFEKAGKAAESSGKEVEKASSGIEDSLKKIAAAAGIAFSVAQLKQWATQVMMVRGEFQQLEVAFTTMLGSADKANNLMNQLVKTAATTPFDLKGVAAGAKSLMAYGTAAENVNDMLVRLGDIAAGMSIPLNDLVYLYGTTMVQGRMFTQDLRQFQGRGIPIAEELAKVLGVAKDRIPELVSAGKITSEVFDKAIHNMTEAGSKFGGLMDAQSKTITGQISNIEDSIDMMLNNIGKQSEGIINGTLSTISTLVENYEKVGKVIVSLIAVYGSYKVAVMFVAAAEGMAAQAAMGYTIAQQLQYKWLLLCEKAQKLLNATMLKNPYVLVATLIAGVVVALWNMKSAQEMVNDAEEEYNRKKDEQIRKEKEHKQKIDELISTASDEKEATEVRVSAMHILMNKYPALFEKYNTEIEALKDIAHWKQKIAEIEAGNSIQKTENELANVDKRIKELEKKEKTKKTKIKDVYNDTTLQWERKEVEVSALTEKEKAELKMLRNKRGNLQNQKKKEDADAYLSDLTGVSNGELQRQINERSQLIAKLMQKEGDKKYGKVQLGGATGVYSIDELKAQKKRLEMEQNRRKQVIEEGSKNFISETKKAYDKEKQVLEHYRSLSDPSKRKGSKETIKVGGKDVKVSQLTQDQYESAVKEQEEKVEAARKKYESTSGKSIKSGQSEENKRIEAALRKKELLTKQEIEQARREQDLLFDTRQAEIEAEEDSNRKLIAQIELNHEKKMAAIERAYEDERLKRIEEAKNLWSTDPSNKGKDFYQSSAYKDANYNTEEETKNRDARIKAENKAYSDAQKERKETEQQALLDYLKAYGDYEQKKLAITEEYEQKIKNASSPIERANLLMQKDEQLEKLNAENISNQIDWSGVFSDLEGHTKSYLEGLRDQLQSLLNSGNVSDTTQMATIQEKIQAINDEISKQSGLFDFVGERQREHNRLVNEAIAAEERRKELITQQIQLESQQAYIESKIRENLVSMGMDSKTNLTTGKNKILDETAKKFGRDSVQYKQMEELLGKLAVSEGQLAKARKETAKATTDAKNAEDKSKRKGSQAIADWFTDAQEFISKKGIDQIPNLLDQVGFGAASEKVQKGLDGINDAAGAAADFASGNYIGALTKGISAISNLGDAVGAWSNSNVAESEAEIDRLVKSNSELGEALNDLRDELKDINLSDTSTYQKAQEVANAQIQNGLRVVQTKMGEYDGHHSTNYYSDYATSIIKGIAENAMRQGVIDYRNLPSEHAGISEFLKYITPDELDKLRTFDPQGWIKFMNALRDADKSDLGAADALLEYVNNYSDIMKDLEDEWKETMLDLSWDSLKDSFKSALEDMKKDVDSWSDDLTDVFRKGASNYLSTKYTNKDTGKLAQWYEKYYKAMESGGLDATEVNKLREEYLAIVKEATAERDKLYETLKIRDEDKESAKQDKATFNSAKNITYEQADSLVGIETAQQIILEQSLHESLTQTGYQKSIAEGITAIQPAVTDIRDNVAAIVETQSTMNNHLADISSFTSVLPEMKEDLYRLRKLVEEQ